MTSRVPRPDTEVMAERILMIDDDSRLAGMVSDYLGGAGFRLTIAGTAREGEALLKRETFDAIILDLMLPDADGLDLCRRLRTVTDLPILMLTARGEPMDRVIGLEVGADDYLAKPFEPRELQARLRAILRRKGTPTKSETLSFGRLEIDKGARVVRVDGGLGDGDRQIELVGQIALLRLAFEQLGPLAGRQLAGEAHCSGVLSGGLAMRAHGRGLGTGGRRVVQDRGGIGGGFGVMRQARQVRRRGPRRRQHM